MSEELNNIPATPGGDDAQPEEGVKEELILGKYKTQDDLIQAYGQLEGKLGDWKQKEGRREELESYVGKINPIMEMLDNADNADIADMVRERLGYKAEPQSKQKEGEDPSPESVRLTQVEKQMKDGEARERRQVYSNFKSKHNIDNLPKEEQDKIIKGISAKVEQWGANVSKVTPERLGAFLDDALSLVQGGKQIENARNLGQAQAHNNAAGVFGSSSSAQQGLQTDSLSSNEAKVAKALGVSTEDYSKTKKTLEEARNK